MLNQRESDFLFLFPFLLFHVCCFSEHLFFFFLQAKNLYKAFISKLEMFYQLLQPMNRVLLSLKTLLHQKTIAWPFLRQSTSQHLFDKQTRALSSPTMLVPKENLTLNHPNLTRKHVLHQSTHKSQTESNYEPLNK